MPTVYIETSIVSFLRENPKAEPDSVLRQQMTRAWWDFHRHRYDLVTAQYVVDEANNGNAKFAAERLGHLAQIALLPLGVEIDRLATEILSRESDYLFCRFPNGAVALAPHLKDLEECWPGGFARNAEEDKALVAKLQLPSDQIALKDFRVNGHTVSYEGRHAVAFRSDEKGSLTAFCGAASNQITIAGRTTRFADQPMALVSWAPVDPARRVEHGAVMQILIHGSGEVRIPAPALAGPVDLILQGRTPGSRSETIPGRLENGVLTFTATPANGRWLYVVPRQAAE